MPHAANRVTQAQLRAYRAQAYRLKPALRLKDERDALAFVNQRGFVYFWPIKGVELPSLWAAVAGARPVSDQHDDPGHVTWGWKDKLLGAKRWFYAKVLRGRATMISLKTLPHFYALSENYGDSRHDYLQQYQAGHLTAEAKAVFEALLEKGPLDTLALRREARMTHKDSSARFERALVELQTGLKILPVGVAEAGAWRYAFIYELVDRWFPDVVAQARPIGRGEARAHLADLYLKSVGAATEAQIAALFRWRPEAAARACDALVKTRKARRVEVVAGQKGEWLATPGLLA
jgi:hypothetical protein